MGIFDAKWICEKDESTSPVFRRKFLSKQVDSAVIDICGLGYFELYINGIAASDAVHEPAVSTYARLNGRRLQYPLDDVFQSPRVYYCRHDITDKIKIGENLISIHLGNGFFNQGRRTLEGDFMLGSPRLIFSLILTYTDGTTEEILSDTNVLAGKSQIIENNIFYGEIHDLSIPSDFHSIDFDDTAFSDAIETDAPEGELTLYEYDYDRVIRTIKPTLLGEYHGKLLYDLGENISGRIKLDTSADGEVIIEHSEEITEDFKLDFESCGGEGQIQSVKYIGDGNKHTGICPHFSWQAFRYFTVSGNAENLICEVIHTDIMQTGFFSCDNKLINDILDIYIRTQLANIHGSVPSDCPHRERLGYTGDGQITCETVMHFFDGKKLYRKWLQDIKDCRNKLNGHIQHTAPFFGGGGGPSGWGGAIVILPYIYYKMYGDEDIVKSSITQMLHYIEYMENHCENGLVTHEEKDGWCLGDWCYEDCYVNETVNYDVPLTAEYVNTCYLVKFIDYLLELDEMLGLGLDTSSLAKYRAIHVDAIMDKYFDDATGDFCGNSIASNAYAVDINIGDERTLSNLVTYYDGLGCFDTGIFGTEILIRVLTEHGYTKLVYKLLTSTVPDRSFGSFIDKGYTTIPENWNCEASHNHPMFGGCLKAVFTAFAGIRNIGTAYSNVLITPIDEPQLGNFSCSINTPYGRISVDKTDSNINVDIPQGVTGRFIFRDIDTSLDTGINKFTI